MTGPAFRVKEVVEIVGGWSHSGGKHAFLSSCCCLSSAGGERLAGGGRCYWRTHFKELAASGQAPKACSAV